MHNQLTNPIELTFARVELQTRLTKEPGSRTAGLTMAFKLLQTVQEAWHQLDAHNPPPACPSGHRAHGIGERSWWKGQRRHGKRSRIVRRLVS
jgi:hypothetical protein